MKVEFGELSSLDRKGVCTIKLQNCAALRHGEFLKLLRARAPWKHESAEHRTRLATGSHIWGALHLALAEKKWLRISYFCRKI